MGRLVINPDGTIGTPPELATAGTALLIVGGLLLLLVLVVVSMQARARWYNKTPPDKQPWWADILAIERSAHGSERSFQARTARLVWHAFGASRGAGSFESLWKTPAGCWFYVHASLVTRDWRQSVGPLEVDAIYVGLLTPRRAHNALLLEPRLLAREFPQGPPSDDEADTTDA